MRLYESMTHILQDARDKQREIRFIDGEKDESVMTFGELWNAATGILGSLQARGVESGDELVIFTRSNKSFIVAFWAAILGGIVPVPVAVGISDEHRFKLFRILRQLERGTLFTEFELFERVSQFAEETKALLTFRKNCERGRLRKEIYWTPHTAKSPKWIRRRRRLSSTHPARPVTRRVSASRTET